MTTRVLMIDPAGDYSPAIAEAVRVVRNGGTVAFPTETVYGVAARADLPEAVQKLRDVKGRAETKPFTVHIGRRSDASRFVPDSSLMARRLMNKGWPGPITLVFTGVDPQRAPVVAELGQQVAGLVYHENSIGLRFPDDRVASSFLAEAGVPIVAASANRAGQPVTITGREALNELGGSIDLLLDAGRARYGKASTIIELSPAGYSIIRTGVIDERTVKRLAMATILFVCTGNTCRSPMAEALGRQILALRLGCGVADLREKGVEVISAGTAAMENSPATAEAVEVMRRRGLELSHHSSQRLSRELINRADYVFTMTQAHLDTVLRIVPEANDRVRLMIEGTDVEDPIGLDVDAYEACARELEAALKIRLAEVQI